MFTFLNSLILPHIALFTNQLPKVYLFNKKILKYLLLQIKKKWPFQWLNRKKELISGNDHSCTKKRKSILLRKALLKPNHDKMYWLIQILKGFYKKISLTRVPGIIPMRVLFRVIKNHLNQKSFLDFLKIFKWMGIMRFLWFQLISLVAIVKKVVV